MKRKIFSILFALVLVLSFSLVTAVPALAATINVPTDYSTIQAAVNASSSGDTIIVAAGTYNPTSTIVINKDNLVLQGPQANVDPRPSQGSTRTAGSASEAVIDGTDSTLGNIILVDAENVVINGLEVKSGTKDMIYQGNPHTGTTVKYCIIHDGLGDEGVQLKKCTNGVLEYNYVFEIADAGDGLNIADTSSYGVIRYNEVAGIHGENAAIYIYGAEHMEIIGNLVRDSGIGGNDGIKVGSKGGDNAALRDILIKDNVIHDITQDGISVYMSGVTVEGNEIYNCHSENGAIYLAFAINDITIQNNSVHDNVLNPSVKPHVGGIGIESPVDAASVHINFNNICNNTPYGVNNNASDVVDATCNWWGHSSGPYHLTSNPGGTGDRVSDNVCFDPWLQCSYPLLFMSEFKIDLASIDFGNPGDDRFSVKGTLELDLVNGDGVDISDDVTVTVGTLCETICCETICMVEKGKKGETCEYKCPKGSAGIITKMKIDWKKGEFEFSMDNADLSEVTNPVTISIQIGDDFGIETILMRVVRWEYKAN